MAMATVMAIAGKSGLKARHVKARAEGPGEPRTVALSPVRAKQPFYNRVSSAEYLGPVFFAS